MGGPEEPRGAHEAPGRARGVRALVPCGPILAHLDVISTLKNPINRETPKNRHRSGVPPPQASRATKNQSGARSGTLPEGETITGGHLDVPRALLI